jgi:hypothetical protein
MYKKNCIIIISVFMIDNRSNIIVNVVKCKNILSYINILFFTGRYLDKLSCLDNIILVHVKYKTNNWINVHLLYNM